MFRVGYQNSLQYYFIYLYNFSFNRSFLGGHLIVINGTGFGSDANGVAIAIDSVPCAIQIISDSELNCLTGSTANTQQITNNA